MDVNGKVLGGNDNVIKFVGLEKLEDFVGLSYEEIIEIAGWDEEKGLSFKRDDQEVIKTQTAKVNVEEPVFYDANGNAVYYMSSRIPLFDDNGNIVGVVGISVDISQQKQAEALHLQNKINEERIEATRMLAATIAHELRTPLMSIHMAADSIKNNFSTLISAYEYAKEHGWEGASIPVNKFKLLPQVFGNINREVEYSNLFINMLLMNIQELEVQEKDLEVGSLQKYIDQAVERYPFVGEQRKHLRINMHKDFQVRLVPLLFEHLMFNLIKNGIYYLDAAGKGEIDVWLKEGEKYNRMYFQDGGKGIPAEQLENIFKRFYTNRRQGTGVGLNFCKQVMLQLGGDIHCESKEGEFTRFILEFPKVTQ